MAASITLDEPIVFVAELEDFFASAIGEGYSLASVVEVAAVLAGDVESLGFVDRGEGREIFNQHQVFSGGEGLDGGGGEVKLDSIVKIDSGEGGRIGANVLDLDEFEIVSAVFPGILRAGRVVHELGDSKRQVGIVDEGRLGQAAPLVAELRPGPDLGGLGQDDRLSLVGGTGAEDRHDQQVAGVDGEIEALDGEDVRSSPKSFDPRVRDAEGLELQGGGIVVLGRCRCAPGHQGLRIG